MFLKDLIYLDSINYKLTQRVCIYLCCCRETLMGIAKHYETGESLPEEVYLKLLAARTFRAGSFSLRQVISL
jgi:hypothetical protein